VQSGDKETCDDGCVDTCDDGNLLATSSSGDTSGVAMPFSINDESQEETFGSSPSSIASPAEEDTVIAK